MLRKRFKSFIVILVIVSLISFKSVKANDDISLLYDYISSASSTLTISGGTATSTGTCVVSGKYTCIMVMTLQSRTADTGYSTYASWNSTFTGSGTKKLTKTKSLAKSRYYRVKVVCEIYSGGNLKETATVYSNVKYY